MVILEAIATGLPVVYCDDNLTEGLTTDNALLTRGIEGEDFALAFNELLNDTARLKKMSNASIIVAKQFDRHTLAKNLLKLYQSTVGAYHELGVHDTPVSK